MDIRRVAVIGAGTMGNGIAHVFAQYGFDVMLIDVQAGIPRQGARDDRRQPRPAGQERDAHRGRRKPPRSPSISRRTDLDAGAAARRSCRRGGDGEPGGQERASSGRSTPPARPDAILASNTSSISITELACRDARGPDKVIGMHFMNPVPVMKLVEVIRGLATSDETVRDGHGSSCEQLEKTPVEVNDYPGIRREPGADADDQRGDLLRHGRCRDARRRSTP